MLQIFSEMDVIELKENPSDNTKLGIVNKLARNYNNNQLTDDEKIIADQVLKLLAKDISKRIRISISEKFCQNNNIPYEVALQLANDMEEFVAVPMIQFSKLLTESDLTDIVKKHQGKKQMAVARRADLTTSLTGVIIDYGSEQTIESLTDNEFADLTKEQCEKIIERHKNDTEILRGLIENKRIDDDGTLEIIMNSSESLKSLIISKYGIAPRTVSNLVQNSKEATIMSMIRANLEKDPQSLSSASLVDKLYNSAELTFPLLIKALSIGATEFFFRALAKFTKLPPENVKKLIREGGAEGTEQLFSKAKIPERMANATYLLVKIVQKEQAAGSKDIENKVMQELHSHSLSNEDKSVNHLFTILSY